MIQVGAINVSSDHFFEEGLLKTLIGLKDIVILISEKPGGNNLKKD